MTEIALVIQCRNCGKWSTKLFKKNRSFKCPYCNKTKTLKSLELNIRGPMDPIDAKVLCAELNKWENQW